MELGGGVKVDSPFYGPLWEVVHADVWLLGGGAKHCVL